MCISIFLFDDVGWRTRHFFLPPLFLLSQSLSEEIDSPWWPCPDKGLESVKTILQVHHIQLPVAFLSIKHFSFPLFLPFSSLFFTTPFFRCFIMLHKDKDTRCHLPSESFTFLQTKPKALFKRTTKLLIQNKAFLFDFLR